MEGYRVVTMDYAADKADIFVTATGNIDVITYAHMAKMKTNSIVCNIGHFDSEIDIASLKDCHWDEIKPQVDHVTFPDGKKIIISYILLESCQNERSCFYRMFSCSQNCAQQ